MKMEHNIFRPLPPIPSEDDIKKMALKGVNAKKLLSKNGSDQYVHT